MNTETAIQSETIRKKSKFIRLWKKNSYALFFLFPWIIGMLVLFVIPMVSSLYLALTNYDLFTAPQWVGFNNFFKMFAQDQRLIKALQVTFTYVFVGVPFQLCFALSVALALNKGIPGLPFFRAVYYVPSLLGGSVAIAILWRQLFGVDGILNKIFLFFGLTELTKISWITDPKYAIYMVILLLVWQFGSPMLIFLAGLRQIPSELYEAAEIDGASRFQQFTRITTPLITPIIFFNLVMQIIHAFQAFTPSFIISRGTGGILDSLLFYTLYLYILGFTEYRMGYASAMAWILLLIIAFFTGLLFLSSRRWVYYAED